MTFDRFKVLQSILHAASTYNFRMNLFILLVGFRNYIINLVFIFLNNVNIFASLPNIFLSLVKKSSEWHIAKELNKKPKLIRFNLCAGFLILLD